MPSTELLDTAWPGLRRLNKEIKRRTDAYTTPWDVTLLQRPT
jgi:hypothetical protein